jgi:hypothetical protein
LNAHINIDAGYAAAGDLYLTRDRRESLQGELE